MVPEGRGTKFDDEASSGGNILLCTNRTLMLLYDLGGDGEPQPGAALFGREVGEEEALPHLVGETGAGVRYDEFDQPGVEQTGGDAQLAEEALLHGLGGVVDQVGERAFEGLGV